MTETLQRRRLRRLAVLVAGLVALVTMVSCVTPSDGQTYVVTITNGSAAAGDSSALLLLPQQDGTDSIVLGFKIGDVLTVTNNDTVPHAIGFLNVRSGETLRYLFTTSGRFEGDCTLLGDTIVIEVT